MIVDCAIYEQGHRRNGQVPTLIAGIYGMNLDQMPELGWTFGYPLAVGVMLVICSLLYRYFRRAGWL